MTEPTGLAHDLRTPRAAAVAGIAFSLLLGTVIVLMWTAGNLSLADSSTWLRYRDQRHLVQVALELVPFAGIAFLWFIGVVRSRLGTREDKLFASVFLGSGLLFIAMLFSGSAVLGALIRLDARPGAVDPSTLDLGLFVSSTLLGTFGTRMAAVFTLSVTSLGLRTRLVPRWLGVAGYVCAVLLLLSPPLSRWNQVLFPAWVLVLSVHILIASYRRDEPA